MGSRHEVLCHPNEVRFHRVQLRQGSVDQRVPEALLHGREPPRENSAGHQRQGCSSCSQPRGEGADGQRHRCIPAGLSGQLSAPVIGLRERHISHEQPGDHPQQGPDFQNRIPHSGGDRGRQIPRPSDASGSSRGQQGLASPR